MMNSGWLVMLLLLLAGAASAQGAAPNLAQEAMQALGAGDSERAVELLERHLGDAEDDGQAHYVLANALMNLDRLDAAADHYRRAGELGFQPQGVGYRLARIYARQGDRAAALERLEAIAEAGFSIPSLIENEADFAGLADAPRFQAALETIRAARFPCKHSENHRAFDFWVGAWDVTANGAPAGHNEIKRVSGDCVLYENWTSATGGEGKSFNFYDAAEDHWRQVWIGDRGGVIEFTGSFDDAGVLRYTAETTNPDGSTTLHTLDFYPLDDGSVRQHWQSSTDGGDTWQVAFDGHYVRSDASD